jgi:hypothetical protein
MGKYEHANMGKYIHANMTVRKSGNKNMRLHTHDVSAYLEDVLHGRASLANVRGKSSGLASTHAHESDGEEHLHNILLTENRVRLIDRSRVYISSSIGK